MSWVMKFVFCMWWGSNWSYTFIQSFQVDMVRHAQSGEWYKCQFQSHICTLYVFNSFFTFDNNLHNVQASDARWKKFENWLLSLFFAYFKMQGFLTDRSLLIVSLRSEDLPMSWNFQQIHHVIKMIIDVSHNFIFQIYKPQFWWLNFDFDETQFQWYELI